MSGVAQAASFLVGRDGDPAANDRPITAIATHSRWVEATLRARASGPGSAGHEAEKALEAASGAPRSAWVVELGPAWAGRWAPGSADRKSTRLNSRHRC